MQMDVRCEDGGEAEEAGGGRERYRSGTRRPDQLSNTRTRWHLFKRARANQLLRRSRSQRLDYAAAGAARRQELRLTQQEAETLTGLAESGVSRARTLLLTAQRPSCRVREGESDKRGGLAGSGYGRR